MKGVFSVIRRTLVHLLASFSLCDDLGGAIILLHGTERQMGLLHFERTSMINVFFHAYRGALM